MAKLMIPQAQSFFKEDSYSSEFLKYKGYYDRIPPFKSALNAIADAVTSSWACKGANGAAMASLLDKVTGNGKQTFKILMNNCVKTYRLGGDAYFEIIVDENLDLENLVMLPPENIRQIIKNGVIKRYEEMDGDAKWKPQEILHFAWNQVGVMTHGQSDVPTMENMLIDVNQLWDNIAKLVNRYIKPIHVLGLNTDDPTEIANFKTQWQKIREIPETDLIIPAELVKSIERVAVPQGSTFDPATFEKMFVERLLQYNRVPDLALGTGTVNSEESARMKFSGFRQAIRFEQQFIEDTLQSQLFPQFFPEDTPTIEFSFAAEPQEEKFERMMNMFTAVNGSALNEEIKGLLLISILQEMGLVPKELNL